MQRTLAQVIETRDLSPRVRLVTFRTADGSPFVWRAGQHIDVALTVEGEVHKRTYSLATLHDVQRSDVFAIIVTLVGRGTVSTAMHNLSKGANVEVYGPRGRFCADLSDADAALFIGAGSGIAPLRAMIEEELRRGRDTRIGLVFGARTSDDLLFHDEFKTWAAHYARFRYEPTLSQASDGHAGRTGRVQGHIAELLAWAPRAQVYVSGPRAMVTDVKRFLEEQGVPADRVHVDE